MPRRYSTTERVKAPFKLPSALPTAALAELPSGGRPCLHHAQPKVQLLSKPGRFAPSAVTTGP